MDRTVRVRIHTHTRSNGFRQRTKKALIVSGGYAPHQPKEIAEILADLLRQDNFDVEISETWDVFNDKAKVMQMDLIVPNWTEGTVTPQQLDNLLETISNGTGLAGLHGGMGYTFPCESRYQLMVGGNFAAHPGYRFKVLIKDKENPITRGISDFEVATEHYYMRLLIMRPIRPKCGDPCSCPSCGPKNTARDACFTTRSVIRPTL